MSTINLKANQLNIAEVLFGMGGLGVLLFVPAYMALKSGWLDYKSLLLLEGFLFAKPHLISTYLRVYSSQTEIKHYQNYTLWLPFFLLSCIGLILYYGGTKWLWLLGSIYFYWQWWHHARQSYGLGRKYQKQLLLEEADQKYNDAILWSLAVCGILLKSNIAGDYYEGIPLRVLHLPLYLIGFCLVLTVLLNLLYWGRQIYLYRHKQIIQKAFLSHYGLHALVFIVFFGLLPTDLGIIAASFWHCTQYISFVKEHQNQKVHKQILETAIWQKILKPQNWLLYILIIWLLGFGLHALNKSLTLLSVYGLVLTFNLSITFHHYWLDAIIWTRKEINWSLNAKAV
jgi:uncharacterized membrane protein YecN with MAPEG domain